MAPPWAFVPSPLFGVGPALSGWIAVRSAIATTAGSSPPNNEKLVFRICSHGGNLSNPLTVGGVVAQWAHWYTQRYQLLEWERKIGMYLDDNDWGGLFAGMYRRLRLRLFRRLKYTNESLILFPGAITDWYGVSMRLGGSPDSMPYSHDKFRHETSSRA